MNLSQSEIIDFECELKELRVFTNPHTGRTCSAGSYGTVFSFTAFDSAWNENRFTRAQWMDVVKYYRFTWYLSPIFGILAAAIARKLGFPSPLNKDTDTEKFYS